MIALADCNNFYASCERVFNPKLKNKPLVVLSNNDGCIIARSNEAKTLGIKMGEPVFKIRDIIQRNNVHLFSTNFALYGDMSSRVMSLLSEISPSIEIYSIDEAFMDFKGIRNMKKYATEARESIKRSTGIPISIGIAKTKTLAKIANHIAKRQTDSGVYKLENKEQIASALRSLPVSKLWGVGAQTSRMLNSYGVKTAHDFVMLNEKWVLKKMTITGLKMHRELLGENYFSINNHPDKKKSICTSRSFSSNMSDFESIKQSIVSHATRCAEKLRAQQSCARNVSVILQTNPFSVRDEYYSGYKSIDIETPSSDSIDIIAYATKLLKAIYKKGFHYKKSGVIIGDIIPQSQVQLSLFSKNLNRVKLYRSVDFINKTMGRDKIQIAGQGILKRQRLAKENLSPCYTTRWSDLLKIQC